MKEGTFEYWLKKNYYEDAGGFYKYGSNERCGNPCITIERLKKEYEYIMKEGQTQEPKGEDDWKEKFVDWLCHELRGTTPIVIERIVDHVQRYIRPTAPPSPIKTEGEDERIRNINPCPFCGGLENEDVYFGQLADVPKYKITCIPCGVALIDDRPDKVIANWNNRAAAPPSPVGIDVEALAKKKYAEMCLPAGMTALHDDIGLDDFIRAFKAGYAVKSASYKSNKSIIEWTDFLGDLGWYKVKETGRWEHDDEQGYFQSTEDLVNHYIKESKK